MGKYFFYSIIIAVFLISCKKSAQVSTIDKDLQQKAAKILLTEVAKSKIDSALVLVMSVNTGEIKTVVKITKSDSLTYSVKHTEASINTLQEPGSIFIPCSIMASMEQSNISMNDTVDTGNGMYNVSGQTFSDRNANKGGFGRITLEHTMLLNSNVGTILTVGKAFNYSDRFISQLQRMSFINTNYNLPSNKKLTPDLIASISIGYDFKMTPLQILTCYNAIANNGRMMKPVFTTGEDSVINPHFCTGKTILAMQQTLCKKGDLILNEIGQINKNKIAGARGTSVHLINSKICDFKYCCAYFPSDKPKYSCLVIFYRERNISEDIKIQNSTLSVVNQSVEYINSKQLNLKH